MSSPCPELERVATPTPSQVTVGDDFSRTCDRSVEGNGPRRPTLSFLGGHRSHPWERAFPHSRPRQGYPDLRAGRLFGSAKPRQERYIAGSAADTLYAVASGAPATAV